VAALLARAVAHGYKTRRRLRVRINNGKSGAMLAFGSIFGDTQIDQMITYIRELRSHQG
jgi:hypothetical protein